jgi:predicted transcriptional regulator
LKTRARTEVITDILQTLTQGPSTMTKIMYGAFLSFNQARDCLRYLAEKNLVSFDAANRLYIITSRGVDLLDTSVGAANLVAMAPFDRVGASL